MRDIDINREGEEERERDADIDRGREIGRGAEKIDKTMVDTTFHDNQRIYANQFAKNNVVLGFRRYTTIYK